MFVLNQTLRANYFLAFKVVRERKLNCETISKLQNANHLRPTLPVFLFVETSNK